VLVPALGVPALAVPVLGVPALGVLALRRTPPVGGVLVAATVSGAAGDGRLQADRSDRPAAPTVRVRARVNG
jgi:hypothetical protein